MKPCECSYLTVRIRTTLTNTALVARSTVDSSPIIVWSQRVLKSPCVPAYHADRTTINLFVCMPTIIHAFVHPSAIAVLISQAPPFQPVIDLIALLVWGDYYAPRQCMGQVE
jgi:hypothetical protein